MKELCNLLAVKIKKVNRKEKVSFIKGSYGIHVWIKRKNEQIKFHIRETIEENALFKVSCIGYKKNENGFTWFTREDSREEKEMILAYYQKIKDAIEEYIKKDPKIRFQVLFGDCELITENFVLRDLQGKEWDTIGN